MQLRRFAKLQHEKLNEIADTPQLLKQLSDVREAVAAKKLLIGSAVQILKGIVKRIAKLTGADADALFEAERAAWEVSAQVLLRFK